MRRHLLDTCSTRLRAAKRSYRANNGQAPRWSQTWGRAMELVQSQWSTQARHLLMLCLRMVPTGRLEVQPSTASGLKRNSRRTYNGSLEYRGMYSSSEYPSYKFKPQSLLFLLILHMFCTWVYLLASLIPSVFKPLSSKLLTSCLSYVVKSCNPSMSYLLPIDDGITIKVIRNCLLPRIRHSSQQLGNIQEVRAWVATNSCAMHSLTIFRVSLTECFDNTCLESRFASVLLKLRCQSLNMQGFVCNYSTFK